MEKGSRYPGGERGKAPRQEGAPMAEFEEQQVPSVFLKI